MLNKIIKYLIIAAMLAWSIWQYADGNIGNGIFINLLMVLPIFLLFRHETNLLAFWFLRRNKLDRARKVLDSVKHPEAFPKTQAAYHHFLKGLIESQGGAVGKSESHFKKALSTGLRMGHDKALANLNLAGIAMSKRRKREAINYMNQAKKQDTAGLLDEQIKMFKKQLGKI